MEYLNEHLWLGQLGHLLIIIAFTATLFSGVAYFLSRKEGNESFKKIGSFLYNIHVISLLGVVALFAFMIIQHYYEYQYVWKYSSNEMQFKYIFSCFWAGQEGSFLTWIFFQMVLGIFLKRSKYEHIASVMGFYALIQAYLMTMILGIYIGDVHVGINPFVLLREVDSNIGLPWTMNEAYLSLPTFSNGQGLNPLLQNYWMTIHPPTIFIGFAAGAVPFAFALGALINKDFYKWVNQALIWNFFGVMILGLGILMGGAWAYESLNFGGFWAWDPVENAILIPWLVMVASAHLMLLLKLRKKAVFATFFMTVATFVLVVYSTFLTRSGVLGETSVHSFTGDGLMLQLILFQILSILVAIVLLSIDVSRRKYAIGASALILTVSILLYLLEDVSQWLITLTFLVSMITVVVFLVASYQKDFPKGEEEDPFLSREFWMFVGTIILVLSGMFVMILTSMPVWQIIFGTDYSGPVEMQDRYDIYNPIMGMFSILITIFIGVAQLLKYKNTKVEAIKKPLIKAIVFALVLFGLIALIYQFSGSQWVYLTLIVTSLFALATNLEYWRTVIKGKVTKAGASIAHIGLAIILIGSVISMGGQKPISKNVTGSDVSLLSETFSNDKNIQLKKHEAVPMGPYYIEFRKKFYDGPVNLNYEVVYFDKKEDQSKGDSLFSLYPFVQMNENFGKVSEPGTKHYWNKDIFTYIKYADFDEADDNWMSWQDVAFSEQTLLVLNQRDTTHKNGFIWRCGSLEQMHPNEKEKLGLDESYLGAVTPLEIVDPNGNVYRSELSIAIKTDGKTMDYVLNTDTIHELNIALTMMPRGLDPDHISVKIENFNPIIIGGHALKTAPVKIISNADKLKELGMFSEIPAVMLPFSLKVSQLGIEYDTIYLQQFKDSLIQTTFQSNLSDLKLRLNDYDFEKNRISLSFSEKEFLIMEATEFPLIILIWIGTILMTLGTIIAVVERIRKTK